MFGVSAWDLKSQFAALAFFIMTMGIDRYNLLLLALTLLSSSLAFAQSETATLSGWVSDPSGLSVPGAQVSLIDIDRGIAADTRTDRSGLYRFASIHPGRYRIEV